MVGSGKPILGEAIATDVGLGALLGGIIHLKLTLASHIAVVPFRAGLVRLSPDFFLLLLHLDIWLGDSLNCLHHGGRVKLGVDGSPVQSPSIQVREDSGIVVPGSLPGIRGVLSVGGEHCSQLKQVKKMLQSSYQLRLWHWGYVAIARL